jgi:hypothetical protein
MGMSETILAAMIGAMATVATAMFQLFYAFKARAQSNSRPRRSVMRSMFAMLALMLASAVGGYLYSEFLKQRATEDLRAMRQEMHDQLEAITSRLSRSAAPMSSAAAADDTGGVPVVIQPVLATVPLTDSLVYVPACHSPSADPASAGACTEQSAQNLALCSALAPGEKASDVALYAQADTLAEPWEQHRVEIGHDLGGAKFTSRAADFSAESGRTVVCVNFAHWSAEHAYFARLKLTPAVAASPVTSTSSVVAAETSQSAAPQAAAVLAPSTN